MLGVIGIIAIIYIIIGFFETTFKRILNKFIIK